MILKYQKLSINTLTTKILQDFLNNKYESDHARIATQSRKVTNLTLLHRYVWWGAENLPQSNHGTKATVHVNQPSRTLSSSLTFLREEIATAKRLISRATGTRSTKRIRHCEKLVSFGNRQNLLFKIC